MSSQVSFKRFSKLILVMVFLVILAGGVVRMTQSGMGCPDWPRCFGRWIPPTSEDQLPVNYKEIYAFKYVDKSFNPYHTWVEYINRTLGALLGLLLVVQFLWSFSFWRSNKKLVWLSLSLLLITGFQGWLGSKVVEGNLEVVKVTIHMLVALMIAALSVSIVHYNHLPQLFAAGKKLKMMSLLAIVLLIIQIILGTQVREQIDHISGSLNFTRRDLWIDQLDEVFHVHRSFSILVAAVCAYLYFKAKKYEVLKISSRLILVLVLLNITLGIIMANFNIPPVAQPLHLLFSSMLITAVFHYWLRTA